MFCPNCGFQLEGQPAFCPECGARIAAEQPQPAQSQPQQQTPVQTQPQPAQQPVYQQPVYQQPVYQQPAYQQPAYQQPVKGQNDYSGSIRIRRWPASVVVFSFFALIVALIQVISLVIYYISIDAFSGNALYSVLFLTGAFLPALVIPIVALASRRGNMFVLGIPIFINLTFFVVQSILRRGMGISRGFMAYAEFSLYIILFILFFVFACIPIRHKTTVLPAIYLPFALILIVIETIMSIQYIVSMIEGSVYVGIWLEIVYYAKILLINVVYIIAMFASRRHKAIVK